jgi:hypothetical protein
MDIEAFWALLEPRIEKTDSCWNVYGRNTGRGYPFVCLQRNGFRKTYVAHRVSFIHFKGSIPNGLFVLHTCDNRGCINPDHLYAGTHQENMRDVVIRGRSKGHRWKRARGERSGRAKLTDAKVREARALFKDGLPIRRIAARMGVDHKTMTQALHGITWSHVT